MRVFLKASYFCAHWAVMAFFAALFFFVKSHQFFPENIVKAKLLAIAVFSVFIPVAFYFLMRSLKLIPYKRLNALKRRKSPLLFYAICLLTINNFIIASPDFYELRCFYWGILFSILIDFFFSFKTKHVNLSILGISAFLGYVMSFSLSNQVNSTLTLAGIILALGWVISYQIALDESRKAILGGLAAGLIPQVVLFYLSAQF